jgi:hypothetical protein
MYVLKQDEQHIAAMSEATFKKYAPMVEAVFRHEMT